MNLEKVKLSPIKAPCTPVIKPKKTKTLQRLINLLIKIIKGIFFKIKILNTPQFLLGKTTGINQKNKGLIPSFKTILKIKHLIETKLIDFKKVEDSPKYRIIPPKL